MDTLAVFCCVFVTFAGLTAGLGVLPDGPLYAAVGGSVWFNTTVPPPTTPFLAVAWYFLNGTHKTLVITAALKNRTGPEYEGRITFFRQTGSLELRKLALNDSGEYQLIITLDDGSQMEGSTRLETLVPVSNINLTVDNTNLVELKSTVRLSCSSLGSSVSFHWLNGSAEVSAGDRVQVSDGGTTLAIAPVMRYDRGAFRCRVSNLVSEGTSDWTHLSVSYGPDHVQITGPSQINTKQTLTLTCSAQSVPSAAYEWTLENHPEVLHNSSKFVKNNIDFSDSGEYSCTARNYKTGKNVSALHRLAVTDETVTACSAGCIAGIVVASSVIWAAVAGSVCAFYHKRKKAKNQHGRNTSKRTGGKEQDNTAETKNQELNYADLSISHPRDGRKVQLELRESKTEYAEVRVNNAPPSYDAHMQRMKRPAPQPLQATSIGRV